MIYSDSPMIYTGQWVQGDWTGFGTLTDTFSGIVYEGGFFDNSKHGLGIIKYPDGRVYDTTFEFGQMMHKGNIRWPDGSKYWGDWNYDGLPHGRGKKEFPGGMVYDGEFDTGVIQGHGRMIWPDGSWHLGEWMDGDANGLGIRVRTDGELLNQGIFWKGEVITGSSLPSSGTRINDDILLYRSSMTNGNKLEGPLPENLTMHKSPYRY
jgi:hypothetical protein